MKRFLQYWGFVMLVLLHSFSSAQTYCSWTSGSVSPQQKFRALTFFVNVIYDVHPHKNVLEGSEFWSQATIEGVNNQSFPTYMLDFLDTAYCSNSLHGTMTRLYGESSFHALQITGDFMVVNLYESTILKFGAFGTRAIINAALDLVNQSGGLNAIYGHNKIEDYSLPNEKEIFFAQFLVRNLTLAYGGNNPGSGVVSPYLLKKDSLLIGREYYKFSGLGSFQCVGGSNVGTNPTSIVMHEFSHLLFGGNEYHTTGGNHRGSGATFMPFISIQGGYGLMGSNGSSLVCCNGYERWRMHWKHNDAVSFISARDSLNIYSIVSDISREDGNTTMILRDFITYGDVIRIRLPYKDSETSSNQYIWLENHQVGRNNKLDFLQFSEEPCRPQGSAGIYAYYQVGRDNLLQKDIHERDNLRPIPAEGFWNYLWVSDSIEPYRLACVNWDVHHYYHQRDEANPFGGNSDLEEIFSPPASANRLTLAHRKPLWRLWKGNEQCDNLPFLGDNEDAFSIPTKLTMATNPSTCNTKTYYNYLTYSGNYNCTKEAHRNTQTTYLSGLSIEMLPLQDGTFKVRIRWDDYDITQSANWTGKIALIESAFLKRGAHIHFLQNRTPAQFFRDDKSGYFAPNTLFNCVSGSCLVQESYSMVTLDEKSMCVVDSGANYIVYPNAVLQVRNGSTLHIRKGATLILHDDAKLVVTPSATLIVEGTLQTSPKSKVKMRRGAKVVWNRNK